MSQLHVTQIRRHLMENYIPFLDLDGTADEHHQLSRAVAALALVERTGMPAKTMATSVTDHAQDGGIDAVAYAADRSTLVLVQSKWTETSKGIQQGDALKFLEGVRNVLNNRWDGFGGALFARRVEIADVLSQPGTKLELVLATTTTALLGAPQTVSLSQFCAEMNDATEIASSVYLGQERLYAAIASAQNRHIDVSVTLRNWGMYQEAGCISYYGTASAQEVVGWYRDHGSLLFSSNIRSALHDTDVNNQIVATASEDPSRFWFFNNGITVIAESFKQAPHVNQKSGSFSFKRASVVNGAQTVSSLHRAAKETPDLLESADVFVRFVTVEDPDGEFARLVTRRTNTQNQVGGREFVSLDPQQERIRMEFAVSGYRYAYRSGEEVTDPARGCDLGEATVALACATGLAETVLVKREIGRLWGDIRSAPYTSLFNPSVTGARVWATVEVMRWVEEDLKAARNAFEGRDWLVSVHSNRLALWAVITHLGAETLRYAEEFAPAFDRELVRRTTQNVATLIVALVQDEYPDSYPQPLFRNQSKVRTVAAKLLEQLQSKT